MKPDARIYVAGHRGLVGSALTRRLTHSPSSLAGEDRRDGEYFGPYTNLITRTHAELDLTNQQAVEAFFEREEPEYVFLAAAKVGGIHANSSYPAQFIRDNLAIQTNVIHAAYLNKVKRLLFLGSSCIYPKRCPQPIKEEYLLTDSLEPTNRPYAVAKIAGIEMCWSYNRQYGTRYLAVMPANLYGPGDSYHPENSHVIPALIRKFHEAKVNHDSTVTVWGTGTPRREFLYSDDVADACVFLMNLDDADLDSLLHGESTIRERPAGARDEGEASRESVSVPPLVNVGVGIDLTISELAHDVRKVVGYSGEIVLDTSMPDGTPRKLLDVRRLTRPGWQARIELKEGLRHTYRDFLRSRQSSHHPTASQSTL